MRSAENPTPTWLRFEQLDSASGETATSSSQGKASRNQFLQSSSRLQEFQIGFQKFYKNPQHFSSQQFQVAKLPVQWMPFPQYPLRSRMEILLQEFLDNPEYPGEVPKEFHPETWIAEVIFRVQTFFVYRHSYFRTGDVAIWIRITLSAKSFVLSSDNTNYKNDIQ